VRLKAPTAVTKNVIFWNIGKCGPYVSRRFGGKYHLIFRGKTQPSKKSACSTRLGRLLAFYSADVLPRRYVSHKRRFT
jgi:hypothetical protein